MEISESTKCLIIALSQNVTDYLKENGIDYHKIQICDNKAWSLEKNNWITRPIYYALEIKYNYGNMTWMIHIFTTAQNRIIYLIIQNIKAQNIQSIETIINLSDPDHIKKLITKAHKTITNKQPPISSLPKITKGRSKTARNK